MANQTHETPADQVKHARRMDKACKVEAPPSGLVGRTIQLIGWVMFVFSVLVGVNKTSEPVSMFPFWASYLMMVGVSVWFIIVRRRSDRWKSPGLRPCFSPYLIGATTWTVLFLFFGAWELALRMAD